MLAENKMVHHSVWTQLEHCCALLWFVIRILDKNILYSFNYKGTCAYFMVTDAWAEKEQKEEAMKQEWLMENGYDNGTSDDNRVEDIEAMPKFEHYDFENWILCNYYPYITIGCQGGAFLAGCLYRCHRCFNISLLSDLSLTILVLLPIGCGINGQH